MSVKPIILHHKRIPRYLSNIGEFTVYNWSTKHIGSNNFSTIISTPIDGNSFDALVVCLKWKPNVLVFFSKLYIYIYIYINFLEMIKIQNL